MTGALDFARERLGGGVGTANWRLWKVESPIPPWHKYPIIATMGAASLQYVFATPPTAVSGMNKALLKGLMDFDFDEDASKIFARTDAYPKSAMDFMTPPGVDDPKLATFRDRAER
jgi:feruloyl esterase